MSIAKTKKTRISINEYEYKSCCSSLNGANLTIMAFNLELLAKDYPEITRELILIYQELPLFEKEDK